MIKEKKLLYLLKTMLAIALFWGALLFENAQEQRKILLIAIFCIFLANGLIRCFLRQEHLYFYISFYCDVAMIFLLEQNSRLLINYFFHSFYIIILLEAVLSLNLRRGIAFGAVAVCVSLIKYGFLIYYKYNFANISQMAFFLLINAFILVIAGFAQYNREEGQRKELLYQELLDTHRKLKQYTDKINRLSVVEERNRIARDIHDTLGHNMTALIMQLQMAEHLFNEDTKRTQELLGNSVKTAKDSLTGIREVVETLRGQDPAHDSLEEIRSLTKNFAEKTGVQIQLDISGDPGNDIFKRGSDISYTAANLVLYRIVQEALTNAVRHGRAAEIYIELDYLGNEIHFLIRDNGVGEQLKVISEGYGLRGIRERVEAFGGQVSYSVDQGFTMQGVLYLEDQNDKDTIG